MTNDDDLRTMITCGCGAVLTVEAYKTHRCPGSVTIPDPKPDDARFDLTAAGVRVLAGEQPFQLGVVALKPLDIAWLQNQSEQFLRGCGREFR